MRVGDRSVYHPVQYVKRWDDRALPYGFDLGSHPDHLPYIEQAIGKAAHADLSTRHTTATPLVVLPFSDQYGFALYHHVVDLSGTVLGVTVAQVAFDELINSRMPADANNSILWEMRDVTDSGPLPPANGAYVSTEHVSTGGRV